MIELIPGLPPNVLGLTAKGTVTAADYESVIIPAVEGAFARQKRIRFLYHLGQDFSRFEAGAMWDDAKIGFKHITGWERVAVVSDLDWIRWAVNLFGFTMPGRVRVFPNSDLTEAKRWICEQT